jgi:hypothetical protein
MFVCRRWYRNRVANPSSLRNKHDCVYNGRLCDRYWKIQLIHNYIHRLRRQNNMQQTEYLSGYTAHVCINTQQVYFNTRHTPVSGEYSGLESDSRQRQRIFSSNLCPDRLWDQHSLLSKGYPRSIPRGNARLLRDADHSTPCSAVVKSE